MKDVAGGITPDMFGGSTSHSFLRLSGEYRHVMRQVPGKRCEE
jgi:hypothetical protein